MGALTIAGHYIIPGAPLFPTRDIRNLNSEQNAAYFLTIHFIEVTESPRCLHMILLPLTVQTFHPLSTVCQQRLWDRIDSVLPLVEIDIDVNWNDVIRQTGLRKFKAHKGMSSYKCNTTISLTKHNRSAMNPNVGPSFFLSYSAARSEKVKSHSSTVPGYYWRHSQGLLYASHRRRRS